MTRMSPLPKLKIEEKEFFGLPDSGADTTVISPNQLPSSWPNLPTGDGVTGIALPKNVLQSACILAWEDQEGDTGTVQPFIVPDLSINLWGRDVLEQMEVYMVKCKNKTVLNQMLAQGHAPGMGLGKTGQGITEPILPSPKHDHAGLGFTGSPFL